MAGKFLNSRKKRVLALAGAALFLFFGQALYLRLFGDILSGIPFSDAWLDRDGNLLRIFLTPDEKYRDRKALADFPPDFVEAVLLQEDRYFYGHAGINPAALLKAGWETYGRKSRRMGASTITMQLARLKYGLHTATIPGKLNQIAKAIWLDLCFSKDDILEAYLNLAPCGRNIEGFPAASWYYFNMPIGKLDLSQLLTLAVIPQDPQSRAPSPARVPAELLEARSRLFGSWLADHPEDGDHSTEIALDVDVLCRFPFEAPHFTEWLEARRAGFPKESNLPGAVPAAGATRTAGRAAVASERRTTLDRPMQSLCEETLDRYIEQNRTFGISNGAMLLADWTTMEVLASVGSADYFDDSIQGQVNGTAAKRSPGSTLKPFIYALAVEQGLIHPQTMLKDTPVSFNEYTPDNFGSDFAGPVPAVRALVDSRNIPAVALARDIRNPDLWDFLENAGISDLKPKDHYGLSIVLGSAEVSMMELVKLYGAIANGGILKELAMAKGPLTAKGTYGLPHDGANRLSGAPKRVLSPESAFITRKMLEENVPPVTVRPKTSKNVPVAFKTGTSIGFKDCWSIAIFDRYILCVWIGNFDGRGNNSFQGRTMATPLLFRTVDSILAGIPESARLGEPAAPDAVARIPVCGVSGGIPGPDCPDTILTWFIPGVSPITGCRIHRRINIDTRTGWRTDEPVGRHVVSEVREFWPTDLLELFAEAGLPRLVPPPYPPDETRYDNRREGFPPAIISPLSNANYVLRSGDAARRSLVLVAAADSDARELFWFADSAYIGRASPGGKLLWDPETGTHLLTAVDQKGRSGSIRLTVTAGE